MAESRYTLKELTFVWHMYGGSDFSEEAHSSSPKERVYSAPDLSRFVATFIVLNLKPTLTCFIFLEHKEWHFNKLFSLALI